jgi:hypothetical protein
VFENRHLTFDVPPAVHPSIHPSRSPGGCRGTGQVIPARTTSDRGDVVFSNHAAEACMKLGVCCGSSPDCSSAETESRKMVSLLRALEAFLFWHGREKGEGPSNSESTVHGVKISTGAWSTSEVGWNARQREGPRWPYRGTAWSHRPGLATEFSSRATGNVKRSQGGLAETDDWA